MARTVNFDAVLRIGGALSSTFRGALNSTGGMFKNLSGEIRKAKAEQRSLMQQMAQMSRQGPAQVGSLVTRYQQLTTQISNAQKAQDRLNRAMASQERINARAASVAKAGGMASSAGRSMLQAAVPSMQEARSYELETGKMAGLGMGTHVNTSLLAFAKNKSAYGVSQTHKAELARDVLSIVADEHHAEDMLSTVYDMSFGNRAVFGQEQGGANERQMIDLIRVAENRGAVSSPEKFRSEANLIQKVISATGGRVNASDWMQYLTRGGIAAASMPSKNMYAWMEPLVQAMGGDTAGTAHMSLYNGLYQGRTTKRAARNLEKLGLIADPSKVHHDKSGQLSFMDPGALKGAQLFKDNLVQWARDILLPTLKAQGITDPGQINDAIGMIVSNRTGANMLAEIVRLMPTIEKAAARNQGAMDVDQLAALGKTLTTGKELEAEAKYHDAKLEMGKQVLPIYTLAINKATEAMQWMTKEMGENSNYTKAFALGVTGLGAGLSVLGPVLTGTSALMNIYAAAQLRVAAAGVQASLGTTAMGAAAATTGRTLLGVIGTGLKFLGVVGLIAGAAYTVYDNWSMLTRVFGRLWDNLKSGAAECFDWMANKLFGVQNAWAKTKAVFGSTDDLKQAQAEARYKMTQASAPVNPNLPKFANPAFGGRDSWVPGTVNNTFNVTQLPGESGEAFAKRTVNLATANAAPKSSAAMHD